MDWLKKQGLNRFAVIGFLGGLVFLVYGVWLEVNIQHLNPSLDAFLFLQRTEPMIVTLDFAPIVFGLIAGLLGRERNLSRVISQGKKEWEATFDAFAEPIFVTKADGKILRCNRAVLGKMNASYSQVIGMLISDLFPGEELTLDDQSSTKANEFPWHGRLYNLSVYRIKSQSFSDNFLVILYDVSERKQERERGGNK